MKRNGIYLIMACALAAVLCISGIAGYRSGMADKKAAENAAQFRDAALAREETRETEPFTELDAPSEPVNAAALEETEDAAPEQTPETFGAEAKLLWPCEGAVLKPYSMDTTIYFETLDQYAGNPGLMIEADVNAQFVAAFGGTVSDIREDSQYGTVLTVDMGDGYETIYGQVKDLTVDVGDPVVKGQALGYVAEPTGYYTKEGSHLFFAVRKDGTPKDPADWLAER